MAKMYTRPLNERWRPASLAIALASLLAVSACTTADKQDSIAGAKHVCSSCRMGGKSVSPTFPRLAGQQKDYIVTELKAFRDHTRADPHAHTYMWDMATQLSDPTIDGLADSYSSQSPIPGTPGNAADVAAGKKIYEEGIAELGVPACSG